MWFDHGVIQNWSRLPVRLKQIPNLQVLDAILRSQGTAFRAEPPINVCCVPVEICQIQPLSLVSCTGNSPVSRPAVAGFGDLPCKPLDRPLRACDSKASAMEARVNRSEIWRVEKYLRNLFRLDTITLVERPKQPDSVEVMVNGEFIGVVFRDEEDGEVSYAFNMAILEMDLPPAPASRAG